MNSVADSSGRDADDQRFERASDHTRAFLCMGRCLQAKKSCILILLVALLLVTQFTQLFVAPGRTTRLQETAEKAIGLLTSVYASQRGHKGGPGGGD